MKTGLMSTGAKFSISKTPAMESCYRPRRTQDKDFKYMSKELKVNIWKKFSLKEVKEALQALFAKDKDGRILMHST